MTYARRRTESKRGYNWTWWVVCIAGLLCMAFISVRMMDSVGSLEGQQLDNSVFSWRRGPQAQGEPRQLASKALRPDKLAPSQAPLAGILEAAAPAPLKLESSSRVSPPPATAATDRSVASGEPPAKPSPPDTTEVVDLSLGRPATGDVHGNLGPPKLVTAAGGSKDWLKDRWQAATGMSGVPIPGEHWLRVDLADAESRLERVVLDFEVAHAKIYLLETSKSDSGPWRKLTEVRTCCSKHLTVRSSGHHVVHTITRPAMEDWKADRFVRARFTHLATMWGVSVYRFRVFGRAVLSVG